MRILDSHEFIELYRGDKDLRIGKILCSRFGCEYFVALPGVSSPADQRLLRQYHPDIDQMKPFPKGFEIRKMKSALVYLRKGNLSLGGFFQISPGYVSLVRKLNPDLIFECMYTTMTPRMYMTAIGSKLRDIPRVYLDVGDIPRMGPAKRLLKILEPQMLRDSDRVITYNQLGRSRMITHYRLSPDIVQVVPKPVDTLEFSPRVNGDSIRRTYNLGSSLVVAYFGRLDLNKGSDVLMRVARLAAEDPKLRETRFMFVGGHLSNEHEESLRIESSNLGLKSVILTGYVDHRRMPEFQAAADVAIYPDITNLPGFPQVLAESMSSGKAIIAGNKGLEGGTPISHMESGLVVNPRSASDIIESIRYLSENRAEISRLGRAARQFAEKYMDWEVVAEKYYGIFNEVLSRRKHS